MIIKKVLWLLKVIKNKNLLGEYKVRQMTLLYTTCL